MTGNLFRLHVTYEDAPPAAPGTLIAKFSAEDEGARAIIHGAGFYRREMEFYRQFAPRTPVPTARCFFSHVRDDGASLLLLEDLGTSARTSQEWTTEQVSAVLATLAQLHRAWWRSPELVAPWLRLTAMLEPDGMPGLLAAQWPPFLDKLTCPVDPFLPIGEWITRDLPAATSLFATDPSTLIHNDIQADNLVFRPGPSPVSVLDWQITTPGRCVIDVASLLQCQLSPHARREHELRLVREYHAQLGREIGESYDLDRCWREYRIAKVLAPARLAAAVGMHPGLQAHPGAFWEASFLRMAPTGEI